MTCSRRSLIIPLLLLAVGAGRARADADQERRDVATALWELQSSIQEAKDSGDRAAYRFRAGGREVCEAILARGVKAGLQPNDTLDGKDGTYLFKRAGAICDEYARWKGLVEAAAVIADVKAKAYTAHAVDAGDVTGEWARGYGEFGATCIAQVDAMIAAGVPGDVPVPINQEPMTLQQGKQQHCQALVDWAATFAGETDRVRAEAAAAVAARYKQARFTGDRLKTFIDYDGYAWYVPRGGCTEESNLARLRKARVLYHRLTSNDGTITLRKFEFAGDRLVRVSSRDYDTRGQASAGCR